MARGCRLGPTMGLMLFCSALGFSWLLGYNVSSRSGAVIHNIKIFVLNLEIWWMCASSVRSTKAAVGCNLWGDLQIPISSQLLTG